MTAGPSFMSRLRWALLVLACASTFVALRAAVRPNDATEMRKATQTFLDALDEKQRARARLRFEDGERKNWAFVPKQRMGVPLADLTEMQKNLARKLLASALSEEGLRKLDGVILLEGILREIEQSDMRDPERYCVTVFGDPAGKTPWGWRFEGHHVSLNFSSITDELCAATPFMLGAHPAEVERGPRSGLRVLEGEEDLARALMLSLDDEQRPFASPEGAVPSDILLGPGRAASFLSPAGIPAAALREEQQGVLRAIVELYARNLRPELSNAALERMLEAGPEGLWFLYLGGTAQGEPHYWRVQTKIFAIELDNTQDDANHVHTVWRDFERDFGADLLREHLEKGH